MLRQDLERLTREQLIVEAERLGIPRPRVLTQPELMDEIIGRTTKSERERAKARGWLGRARDLLARVVERGLHLPEAARALRKGDKDGDDRIWPAPPPPLPTVTLAEIYAAQGHLERAVAVLDEVLTREPDHREARTMRERFVDQARRSRIRLGRDDQKEQPAKKPPPSKTTIEVAQAKPAPEPSPAPAAAKADAPAPPEPASPGTMEALAETIAVVPRVVEAIAAAIAAVPPLVAEIVEAIVAEPAPVDELGETIASGSAAPAEAGETIASGSAAPAEVEALGETIFATPVETAPEGVAAASIDEAELAGASTERAPTVPPSVLEPLAEPPLPERYEVDEVVAIAVDPRTVYLYWEVRPTTLAHAQAQRPDGWLCVRIASVIATWEGPLLDSRDLHVDALYGDRFLRDIQPGSNVRVSVGWRSSAGYEPFAVGSEVTAPRMTPVESVAQEVARWEADPVVAPFQSRRPETPPPPAHDGRRPARAEAFVAASAPQAVFMERVRVAGHAHGAPVDTGVESWSGAPGEPIPPRFEEHDVEELVTSACFSRFDVVHDGGSAPAGSSELSRVYVKRVRRLIPDVPRVPRVPRPGPLGGASELSR